MRWEAKPPWSVFWRGKRPCGPPNIRRKENLSMDWLAAKGPPISA